MPNECIPMYDLSWAQLQSDHLQEETNRTTSNGKTVIRGQYGMGHVELTPGAE
jgi:hypothetical protein